MTESISPTARTLTRVWRHPLTKAVLGTIGGILITSWTTGIYPWFEGWASSRTSVEEIVEACKKPGDEGCPEQLRTLMEEHAIDARRFLNEKDYAKLNHAEQQLWLHDRQTILAGRLVDAHRQLAELEAQIRMTAPANRSEAAKRAADRVRDAYDKLILQGVPPEVARDQALKAMDLH